MNVQSILLYCELLILSIEFLILPTNNLIVDVEYIYYTTLLLLLTNMFLMSSLLIFVRKNEKNNKKRKKINIFHNEKAFG